MQSSLEKTKRLAELFVAKYGVVLTCAQRYVETAEQAAEVAQQVFVEFADGGDSWDLEKDVTPLLWEITKRVAKPLSSNIKATKIVIRRTISEFPADSRVPEAGITSPRWNGCSMRKQAAAIGDMLPATVRSHSVRKTWRPSRTGPPIRSVSRKCPGKGKPMSRLRPHRFIAPGFAAAFTSIALRDPAAKSCYSPANRSGIRINTRSTMPTVIRRTRQYTSSAPGTTLRFTVGTPAERTSPCSTVRCVSYR